MTVVGDEDGRVKVRKTGSEVSIECDSPTLGNGVTIISGGGNIVIGSAGKNISIINGDVFINGKRVGEGSSPEGTERKAVKIEIQCPDGLSIDASMTGLATLKAYPCFEKARMSVQGGGEISLQAQDGNLKISGAGVITFKSLGGSTRAGISGSGRVEASGTFDDIDISISGSGRVTTSGDVAGDYDVDISGAGRVCHSGRISGRKKKAISGSGSVQW